MKDNHWKQKLLMFLPGYTIFATIILVSIFLTFYYSFFDWDGLKTSMNFIGFTNYIKALKEPEFLTSIGNTFFFALLGGVSVNIISLFLAVQINRKSLLTNFHRAAFFFPQLISLVAVGFIFKALFSYYGVVNSLFERFGWTAIDFLGDPSLAKWSVLGISIWQATGFSTILYLSGLQAIPAMQYEAAEIDGANSYQAFWNITFPWLAPSFTTVTVFLFTGYMKIFDIIFVLTGGGPVNTTKSIAIFIIDVGFNRYKISYASAVAVYFLIILTVITVTLTNRLRIREENLL
ncbi:MAG: sugar ABC transporter permease [Spirochaetaceae bacterium]